MGNGNTSGLLLCTQPEENTFQEYNFIPTCDAVKNSLACIMVDGNVPQLPCTSNQVLLTFATAKAQERPATGHAQSPHHACSHHNLCELVWDMFPCLPSTVYIAWWLGAGKARGGSHKQLMDWSPSMCHPAVQKYEEVV